MPPRIMFASWRTTSVPHTLLFYSPLFSNRHVFRCISSKFLAWKDMGRKMDIDTELSQAEPLPHGGHSDIDNNRVMPMEGTFQDEEHIMVGRNPVPLHRKNMKNHSPSHPSLPVSEYGRFKGRTRNDLGTVQSNVDSTVGSNPSFRRNDDHSLQGNYLGKKKPSSANRGHNSHFNFNYAACGHTLDSSPSLPRKPFDICFVEKRHSAFVRATRHQQNGERFGELQQGVSKEAGILRPGMILLKNYLTHDEQVKIVKTCRELGLGPGGFYQPGYAGGAKLRLQMMCLGLDWDPQTSKYGTKRRIDDSEPHSIPHHLSKLVKLAIQEAHYLIKEDSGLSCVEHILPSIDPDICIVNFYTTNGRLGLHKDRDESEESLRKRLPVVSFCIGDSAEFLYGDTRDVEKTEKVLLESGDVLIFGGESRHVFHGVSTIIPNSAPKNLLKDTLLRPGRLNLTFRKY